MNEVTIPSINQSLMYLLLREKFDHCLKWHI
jgi:hypothetical protein